MASVCLCVWKKENESVWSDVFLLQDPLIPLHISTLDDVLSLSLSLARSFILIRALNEVGWVKVHVFEIKWWLYVWRSGRQAKNQFVEDENSVQIALSLHYERKPDDSLWMLLLGNHRIKSKQDCDKCCNEFAENWHSHTDTSVTEWECIHRHLHASVCFFFVFFCSSLLRMRLLTGWYYFLTCMHVKMLVNFQHLLSFCPVHKIMCGSANHRAIQNHSTKDEPIPMGALCNL